MGKIGRGIGHGEGRGERNRFAEGVERSVGDVCCLFAFLVLTSLCLLSKDQFHFIPASDIIVFIIKRSISFSIKLSLLKEGFVMCLSFFVSSYLEEHYEKNVELHKVLIVNNMVYHSVHNVHLFHAS